MRPKLAQVRAPVLLMHALEETFVPPSNMEAIYGALPEGDKQMLPIGHSSHVLTLDASRLEVFEAAADFVARIAP
jgi:esterase/lipase